MKQPMIVSNSRELGELLGSIEGGKALGRRLGGKKLELWPLKIDANLEAPSRSLSVLQLPGMHDANKWWDDLWQGDLMEFRLALDQLPAVACVAKQAVWSVLPEIFMDCRKTLFSALAEDRFEQIIGLELTRKMITDASLVGISVRHSFDRARW